VIAGSITAQAAKNVRRAGIKVYVGAAGPARAVPKAYPAVWLRPFSSQEKAPRADLPLLPYPRKPVNTPLPFV
jgi:hypothetical protein